MNRCSQRLRRLRRGVLSFEWVLLLTLLAIGIVGGVVAARDAIVDELGDVSEATIHIDQTYTLPSNNLGGKPSSFTDTLPTFDRTGRLTEPIGQKGSTDDDS